MATLLNRTDFKKLVFARDKQLCVFCGKEGVDAHHIIERKLFPDQGYYIDNGVTVCAEHHIECETTDISVEEIRAKCKIKQIILPEHLDKNQIYDKWGNIILANGTRLKGELFDDESVQKILVGKLHLFTNYVKYPKTYHMPFSKGITSDDKIIKSLDAFKGKKVVLTKKFDGENSSLYNDYIHARSLDSKNHVSRNWLKNFWATIKSDIPEGFRVCGENLFAKHSIGYTDLPTYFLGFSIWNKSECFSWEDTLEWFALLGIEPVEVVYYDIFDLEKIKSIYEKMDTETTEGFVLRVADKFKYSEFSTKVAKMVRANHVQCDDEHWAKGQFEQNSLKI